MASRTIPIGGVTVFEEADTKPDKEREDVSSPPHLLGTEESQGTGSDQGLEHQEPNENSRIVTVGGVTSFEEADTKPDEKMEDEFSWPNLVGTEESRGTGSDQSLMPQEPIENITEGDIHLSPSIAKELNPALANNTSFNVGPQQWDFILFSLILFTFHAVLQVSPPSNNIRGQTSNHSFQPHEESFNDSSANPFVCPNFPPTEMDEESIRRGVDVQLANDTFQDQRCEVQSCSNETEQPVPDNNLHSVNETAKESYLASMSRQEPRQHVSHSEFHTADTCVIEMEPTEDEVTMHNIQPVSDHNLHPVNGTAKESYLASMLRQELGQHNNQNVIHIDHNADEDCRNRPPENQPQGIPHGGRIWIPAHWWYRHGGRIWIPGWWDCVYNTCSLDQFLNGLFQIFRFRPLLQLLEELAGRFPESYMHLLVAVRLCMEGRSTVAKIHLLPYVRDMEGSEGERVMPHIERQLCHRIIRRCEGCHDSPASQLVLYNIYLSIFNLSTGFQEAFRSYFIRHGECRREGCGGRTISNVIFESGTPPLILAVNLIPLHRHIPNSQSVNDSEIVELFGERYMMFLFTFFRPGKEDLHIQGHIQGHYMSRVFIPEGRTDCVGRPAGRWYDYPNNQYGDLDPCKTDQRDPPGTFPSYVYFIRLPAPSEAAPCTVQGEEETPHSEDNEDDG